MVEIRAYEHSDLEALKRLMIELQSHERQYDRDRVQPTPEFAASYLSGLFDDLKERQGIVLVAVDGSTVCGFVAGYVEEDTTNAAQYFHIGDLAVLATHRGRGIGSALIGAVQKHSRAKGFKRLGISVLIENSRAHDLYRRLGFRDYEVVLMMEL